MPRESDVIVVGGAPGKQDAYIFRGPRHEPCAVSDAVPADELRAGPATDERVPICSERG